ncbi:MAG: oligosaccharide flippase family protein, partial [Clostridia bacterium]|nr:oligosaccharide flippase family protein [Clostridia bacterium]
MNTSLPSVTDVQEPQQPKKTQDTRKTSHTSAGESFFSGVLVLTISNLLVKALGMLFKIPMNYIVGDTGMGYYNAAYTIYTFFYMLSTAGLPTAVSILVSAARAA